MGALKAIWNSEKAVALGVLVVCATVLVGLGRMSVEDWKSYTTWLAGFYVAGKTAQGGISAMADAKVKAAEAAATAPSAEQQPSPVAVSVTAAGEISS